MSTMTQEAPGATQGDLAENLALRAASARPGPQRRAGVNAGGTAPRARKVECVGGCGRMIFKSRKANATGKCRECWRAGLGKDGRKIEPAEQIAMLGRMAASVVRRASVEDPGLGLAIQLQFVATQADRLDDIGVELVRKYGEAAVADDLTITTGEPWTRMRVAKRWGHASPAYQRRYPPAGLERFSGQRPAAGGAA